MAAGSKRGVPAGLFRPMSLWPYPSQWLHEHAPQFKKILADTTIRKKDEEFGHSAFIGFNAAFISFIAFQIIAMAMAIMAKSSPFVFIGRMTGLHVGNWIPAILPWYGPITKICWFMCWWVFIYALSLALAATLSIFRLAGLYDKLLSGKG